MDRHSDGAGRDPRLPRHFVRSCFGALLALLLWPSCSLGFEGPVVRVKDGDTLVVLVAQRRVDVRLAWIDAPEGGKGKKDPGQPFGRAAREELASMCAGKIAEVVETGRDRWGRTLGEVTCGGVHANAELVRSGMAWVYVKYAPKDSPLYQLETAARAARLGLWADPAPTPPWEYRHPRK